MRRSPLIALLLAAPLAGALTGAPAASAADPAATKPAATKPAATKPAATGAVVAQITQAEAVMNKAYATNDLKTYFGFYADDLQDMLQDGGRTSLASYRSDWTKMIEAGGHVDKFAYSDMKVQVSPAGDAAVVSYQADVKVTNPDGKPGDTGLFYETDVWFRRGGVWKLVESEYTKAGK